MKDKAESVRQRIPWIESLDQRISKLEEEMGQLRKPHEEPVFGPESVWKPKPETTGPYADWPVKPGDWAISQIDGWIRFEALEGGLTHKHIKGVWMKEVIDDLLKHNVLHIPTPEEVKAHERKIEYPVLAPGDMVETNQGNIFKVRKTASSDFIEVCDGLYTQKDAAHQLEFGYWVKYVREVKP